MKILHIITSLRMGGAERLMVELLPRLRMLGADVELAVFDGVETDFSRELERRDIKIHRLGKSAYSLKSVLKLITLIRNFDIIHTHNTPCQFALALLKPFTKAVLITTEHNTSNRRRGKWYWKLADQWMYCRYKKIICISKAAEENLKTYLKRNDDAILTINNGIDVEKFANAEPADLSQVLKMDVVGLHFAIMVAAFRWEKDQETLIRAYTRLPEGYHLLLVGDGARRTLIEQYIQENHLQNRVHLLGNRNDVPSLLKAASVVVMSSHFEGLSLSSLEGMASGIPFVASDVDGLRDVVNGYGILFPEGDDEILVNIIQKLCTDRPYADAISAKCKDRATQYDIQKMAKGYQGTYEDVIND